MDKERLRIPSDSSSGSSSRGGASPNLSPYCNNTAAFLVNCSNSNNIGPPPNSPVPFSPILPPPTAHSLPPPPGLPHPSLGTMYPFPPSTTTGFQSMNYPIGMPTLSGSQSHMAQHYPSVGGGLSSPYDMNGYSVQSNLMQTQTTSPPPGYSSFYGTHHHSSQPVHPNPQQTRGPFSAPQHGIYNPSGDSNDLERLKLLINSTNAQGRYDNGLSFGSSENMTSKLSAQYPEGTVNSSVMPLGNLSKDEKHSVNSSIGGVMNPIIENLVGSMSMCNGTYTHFGPSTTQVNKISAEHNDVFGDFGLLGRQNGGVEHDTRTLFSRIAVSPINKELKDMMKENGIGVLKAPNPVRKQVVQVPDSHSQDVCQEKLVANTASTSTEQLMGESRASSPRESLETSSRPQTPGKPSYLEVLTKAGGGKAQPTAPTRKASSTSSSPVQSALTSSSDSVPNLSHRKSVDYFVGATASSPASSCPSASSSPATKPRNFAAGMLLKGKENVSSTPSSFHAKQSSISKSSPSNSPTHNIQNQLPKPKIQQVTVERKVLSSQNSAPGNAQKSGKVKNGKVPNEKPVEMNDSNGNDESEWGWKTYTSRGRNNNLNSVGNKNSQKRTSNGSCGSDATFSSVPSVENDEDETDVKKNNAGDEAVTERKSNSLGFGSTTNISNLSSHSRKQKDKEKPRNRREDRNWRNCVSRRLETLVYIWLTHMISALTWLWSLITDVASLSASLGVSLLLDFYVWTKTKALPNFTDKLDRWRKDVRESCSEWWSKWKSKISSFLFRSSQQNSKKTEDNGAKGSPRGDENILSLLGPDRNISLPANGDEALKRLLSVKGQDPYSILGVRSDSSDETIRRYYKRQAVLVHPDKNLIVGAEEAFKILARAFEMVGDPVKRTEYHQKLMEAQAKEKFCGEIGNLLEQLRKKMEAASSTIRCTKCNSRHKKCITDRPLFAARYCSQCRIHHGAREGELWAERGGWFGISWNYFACMDAHIWEINEWARCQKTNLKHIKADAHCVMYRLVAGGNNHQNHHNQHCHGTGSAFDEGAGSEADEWDSLINNLYKTPPGSTFNKTTGVPGKSGCCASGNVNNTATANGQAAGKRRKGKRNK